jgi:mannobiose 2-epimerase
MLRYIVCFVAMVLCVSVLAADAPGKEAYRRLAEEMSAHFDKHILAAWYPRCIDNENGGFIASFDREWKMGPQRDKFLVFQSRLTWLASQVAMQRPALRDTYRQYALRGLDQLEKMWDKEQVTPMHGEKKHLYAISFGIYGAAAAYQATGEKRALELAMRTFKWMDQHAHDNVNGGYHELLGRDGTPILTPDLRALPSDRTGYPNTIPGYKSQNTHIHLLESITTLYQASKDPAVKARLEELLALVRDRIAVEPGALNLFFTPDWRPVPDHDSFGHDIETAYLIVEASEVLGRPDDEKTWRKARMLVDHTLDWGYDNQRGGIYDKGAAFDSPHDKTKVWWSQAEALNALLLMHEKYGQETDRYWKAFNQTWTFVKTYLADETNGGWYYSVKEDGSPDNTTKGNNWKCNYHDGRALLNMHERLERMGRN